VLILCFVFFQTLFYYGKWHNFPAEHSLRIEYQLQIWGECASVAACLLRPLQRFSFLLDEEKSFLLLNEANSRFLSDEERKEIAT
jgi:hypothetical protein